MKKKKLRVYRGDFFLFIRNQDLKKNIWYAADFLMICFFPFIFHFIYSLKSEVKLYLEGWALSLPEQCIDLV